MLELILNREEYTENSTIGQLTMGNFVCYVLEDPVRKEKIYGSTAIPAGRYRIVPHFNYGWKRIMPMLEEVKNYTGIFIHPGNTAVDTSGCLLPGLSKSVDTVVSSYPAYVTICEWLCSVWSRGVETWITINDKQGVA